MFKNKFDKLNVSFILLLLAFVTVLPATSLAEPEAMGRVTGIFPESGILVINGQKYTLSDDVRVSGRVDEGRENPLYSLKSGMNVLYGGEFVNGKMIVSEIIITGEE
jgi:hypothetical protein